jgi:recombinational DNA repair ATPase RecF
MTIKIKSLDIKAFRGIVDCSFNLNGKSLLLFGENGTGKSSITTAIEFLFTEEISSLKGTQGLTYKKHAPNLKFDESNLKVDIIFNNNFKMSKTLTERYPTNIKNSELKNYINETVNGSFILNRKSLLKFILSRPNERYKSFSEIIGINNLEEIENSFKMVNTKFQGLMKDNKQKRSDKISNIAEKLNISDSPEEEKLHEIFNEILKNKELTLINENLNNINKIKDEVESYKSKILKTNFNEILEKIKLFNIDDSIQNDFETIISLKDDIYKFKNVDNEFIDILKKSLKFIDEKSPDFCPVCENKIKKKELTDSLRKKLKKHEEYNEIKDILEKYVTNSVTKLIDIKKNISNIIEKIKEYDEFNTYLIESNKICKKFNVYLEELNKLENSNYDVDFNEFDDLIEYANKKIKAMKNFTENKFKSAEEEKNKKISNELECIIDILMDFDRINELNNDFKKIKKNCQISTRLYKNFKKTKMEIIEKILNKTSKDINNFYSYIHEGDMISDIDFFQKKSSNGIQIKINCMDQEEDPRAFSSEGHLDTLGLCIFLAFIKVFHKNCSLIVLDDIVATVDIPHREKIIRLLFEKFKKKQFIITTHDKLWYDQIINMESIYNLRNNFVNCEIVDWNIDSGPELSNYKPSLEKMNNLIKNRELNCAANEGRRFMENTLKNSCRVNNVKIKMTNKPTVGDMKDSLFSKIKEATDTTKSSDYYNEKFKNIDKSSIVGNLLSHDNPGSENSSKNELNNFYIAIKELHEVLTCAKCGSYLEFNKFAKKIICTEKRCKDIFDI